jgi:type II secretory pathway component PulC
MFTVTIMSEVSCAESFFDIKMEQLQNTEEIKWGRDPFVRYEDIDKEEAPHAPPELKLEGIISDGKKALVIINKGFYRKGDSIDGFTIVEIKRDKVVLEKDKMIFHLGIEGFEERIKGGHE